MQINRIQSQQSFEGKSRFLSQAGKDNLVSLLTKMNKESIFPNKGNCFDATRVGLVSNGAKDLKDRIVLGDLRFPNRNLEHNEQANGVSVAAIGNKISFWINNKTGEIFDAKKPLFMQWRNIIKKYESFLANTNEHYDNKDIVYKGVAKEGSKADFERHEENTEYLNSLVSLDKLETEYEIMRLRRRL